MDKTFIIEKLVTNALSKNQTVVDASFNALKTFSQKNPYLIIEYIDNSIKNVQQITPNLLNLYCFLFLEVTKQLKQNENEKTGDQKKNEMSLTVFVSLQFYYIKSKNMEDFQPWEKLCSEFISSEEIAKKIYPLALNQSNLYSTCSFITLLYCAEFVTNQILNSLDVLMNKKHLISDKISTLISINPNYFIHLLCKLAEKQKENEEKSNNQENENTSLNINPVSQFLSFQLKHLFQYFLEHPNDEIVIKCILLLFDRIYPQACPVHLRYYVTRICSDLCTVSNEPSPNSLTSNHIIMVENMLIKFCSIPDPEIWKKTVDFILKHMHFAYITEIQKQTQKSSQMIHLSHFPIDANEMDPSFSSSTVFSSSLENINKLCFSFNLQNDTLNPFDIVLSSLLASIDTQRAAISYKTLSSLLNASNLPENKVKFSNEQMIMIVSSVTAVVSRNIPEPSLCRLSLDILKFSSDHVSESDAVLVAKYIINSSISMNNSHYLLQIVSIHKEFHEIIFDLVAESLFDETKIALLPSLLQVIHLFLLILSKNDEKNDNINNEDTNDSEDSLQHPLVPVFLKKSIADKSLLLLRMLSCLMSLGAMHPFVPSMISILSVFFDFAFPLAFEEIKSILEAVTKRISTLQPQLQLHLSMLNNSGNGSGNSNSNLVSSTNNSSNRLSEFGSIIMSLLSNIMKLINDSQFRLSLCTAVIHDVEMNFYPFHSQNCLWIFDTIIPFLPVDVASANIEKLFKIIPFYPSPNQANSSQGNLSNQNVSAEAISMVLAAFADVLGSISGRNYKLIVKFIKKWKDMKSNSSFLVESVGKKPQPIPYSFIAMSLRSVSRDVEVPVLLEVANTDLFPLLIQLMKRKSAELNPGYCLNALIELCKRLTFHKVPKSFVLNPNNSASNTDFIFKYVLNTFLNHKQKSMSKLCLAAFRYFIQVPPCLTPEQRTTIKEKVIIPSFIMFTINEIHNNNDGDKQLFLELRGLLFAMICTLPETATILSLLVPLMPNCQNNEVLSLIWRLLSIFDSRREKSKTVTDSSNSNNNVENAANKNNNVSGDDKANSYNSIKFYKPVQVEKISNLPQIITDLLCTVYNRKKNNESSSDLALQSIYLLFRIDRDISDESSNNSENQTPSNDDVSCISNISDISETVLNKLTQAEIDSLLNYSIDKMKKNKSVAASYSFVISQIMKYVSPRSKLALIDSHREQLCADAITNLNSENVSLNVSLAKMQSLITEFVSSSMTNLLVFYDSGSSNLLENNEFFFSFPSPDFVQQLLLKFPEVFVKKLVQSGFNDSTRKILLKSFEEETGQCVEILLQQLCLFLLEMPDDDKIPAASSTLLFISFIIISSTNNNNNCGGEKKKFSFEIPVIHIYQTICSLLIFGFSMNIFLNVKDVYSSELQNKLKNPVSLSTSASSPIMNNSSTDKSQKQQQQRHLFIKVLSLCLSKVPRESSESDSESEKLSILPLDASNAFTIAISSLISSPHVLLLIDVVNFLMSACQLNKSRVSSGIAAFCGEVLCHYKDLLLQSEKVTNENEEQKKESSSSLNILNLFFPTLLSFVINFGEFTCIVSLSEITKFIKRNEIANDKNEFPIHYISRILQVIHKRCSSSNNSNSGPLLITNDVFSAAISCIKQFCKSFALRLNEEMHSILFNILIELLKVCGKRHCDQIAAILFDLVNTLATDEQIPEQLVKYIVVYEIITCKQKVPQNEKKIKIQISENNEEKQIRKFDIQKEENAVVFIFDVFLNSSVPFLISSALNLMKEDTYHCIANHFIEKIASLLEYPDDNVVISATDVIELLPSLFVEY